MIGNNVAGYEIKKSVLFDDDHGLALAKATDSQDNFVVWHFTKRDGQFDYHWGHYTHSLESAENNYNERIAKHLIKDSHPVGLEGFIEQALDYERENNDASRTMAAQAQMNSLER